MCFVFTPILGSSLAEDVPFGRGLADVAVRGVVAIEAGNETTHRTFGFAVAAPEGGTAVWVASPLEEQTAGIYPGETIEFPGGIGVDESIALDSVGIFSLDVQATSIVPELIREELLGTRMCIEDSTRAWVYDPEREQVLSGNLQPGWKTGDLSLPSIVFDDNSIIPPPPGAPVTTDCGIIGMLAPPSAASPDTQTIIPFEDIWRAAGKKGYPWTLGWFMGAPGPEILAEPSDAAEPPVPLAVLPTPEPTVQCEKSKQPLRFARIGNGVQRLEGEEGGDRVMVSMDDRLELPAGYELHLMHSPGSAYLHVVGVPDTIRPNHVLARRFCAATGEMMLEELVGTRAPLVDAALFDEASGFVAFVVEKGKVFVGDETSREYSLYDFGGRIIKLDLADSSLVALLDTGYVQKVVLPGLRAGKRVKLLPDARALSKVLDPEVVERFGDLYFFSAELGISRYKTDSTPRVLFDWRKTPGTHYLGRHVFTIETDGGRGSEAGLFMVVADDGKGACGKKGHCALLARLGKGVRLEQEPIDLGKIYRSDTPERARIFVSPLNSDFTRFAAITAYVRGGRLQVARFDLRKRTFCKSKSCSWKLEGIKREDFGMDADLDSLVLVGEGADRRVEYMDENMIYRRAFPER